MTPEEEAARIAAEAEATTREQVRRAEAAAREQARQQEIAAGNAGLAAVVPQIGPAGNAAVQLGRWANDNFFEAPPSGTPPEPTSTQQVAPPGTAAEVREGHAVTGTRSAVYDPTQDAVLRYDESGQVIDRVPRAPGETPEMLAQRASGGDLTLRDEIGRSIPERPPAPPRVRVAPPGMTTQTFRQTLEAPLTPETQAALDRTGRGVSEAQAAYDLREREDAARRAQGQSDLAGAMERLEQQRAQEEAGRQAQLQARLGAFESSIQDVAAQRVDPEGFFGNDYGRRLGASLFVALGQFAAGMGGGENAALGIINGAIERNIRAQEVNQANTRAVAGLRSDALSQYRAILGDERAAFEAARAAHLQAADTRIAAMIASARPGDLQALQALRARLQEAQAAAQQAVRERAAFSISEETTLRMPGGPRTVNPMRSFGQAAAEQATRGLPEEDPRRALARSLLAPEAQAREGRRAGIRQGRSSSSGTSPRGQQSGPGRPSGYRETGSRILELPETSIAAGGATTSAGGGGTEYREVVRDEAFGFDPGARGDFAQETSRLATAQEAVSPPDLEVGSGGLLERDPAVPGQRLRGANADVVTRAAAQFRALYGRQAQASAYLERVARMSAAERVMNRADIMNELRRLQASLTGAAQNFMLTTGVLSQTPEGQSPNLGEGEIGLVRSLAGNILPPEGRLDELDWILRDTNLRLARHNVTRARADAVDQADGWFQPYGHRVRRKFPTRNALTQYRPGGDR